VVIREEGGQRARQSIMRESHNTNEMCSMISLVMGWLYVSTQIYFKHGGDSKMASILDLTKERDAQIDQHLRDDYVIWLNSVRPDGRPHAVVVWFLWDGDSVLIFSKPNNQKVRNIANNENVLLAVDNTHDGADPITIEGTATLLAPGVIDAASPAYVAKYAEEMKGINTTPERMAAEYSQAIRIQLSKVI